MPGRDTTSASSSTTRVPMEVDSAAEKGHWRSNAHLRELANDILGAIPLLPDAWPLAKIDLILQNTDKYYMAWRRFSPPFCCCCLSLFCPFGFCLCLLFLSVGGLTSCFLIFIVELAKTPQPWLLVVMQCWLKILDYNICGCNSS